MTADQLAEQAGTTLRAVARLWPTARPGLKENQVQNRMANIRRVVRHGNINLASAQKLAMLLDCSPGLFLYGDKGAVEARPKPSGGRAGELRLVQPCRRDRPHKQKKRLVR